MMNIDCHCHLLPGVDDGCQKLEESLEILEAMKSKGAERVYLTPHLFCPRSPTDIAEIRNSWEENSSHLNSAGVEVLIGSEVFLSPRALSEETIPLGGTDLLLIELPTDARPPYLFEAISILQERGYRVIIAHIERYRYFFKRGIFPFSRSRIDDDLFRLKDVGVLFQINWDSLNGDGQFEDLFRNRMIEFVGSDKHYPRDNREIIDFSKDSYNLFMNDYYL